MNRITQRILKKLRKVHTRRYPKSHVIPLPEADFKQQDANDQIRKLLATNKPCLVSRLGGTETPVLVSYLDITAQLPFLEKAKHYIRGTRHRFWWDDKVKSDAYEFSGIFPPTNDLLTRYAVYLLDQLKDINILGTWLKDEHRLQEYFSPSLIRVPLYDLEPYFFDRPWSELLGGKKVLVIHPFAKSIERQYAKHRLLFQDPRVLPDFELKTLKAVQSSVCNPVDFPDWFAALDWMLQQVQATDFDLALIGAGAYGIALGAEIKRMGKQAIHLGAVTQMLFGLRGKRWDDSPQWHHLFNEHWARALPEETPTHFRMLEKGAYW